MAKIDDKDPRFIVEDRKDGRNVHDYHWSERDITRQAKARLERAFTSLGLVDDSEARLSVEGISECVGDATALNRKGRVGVYWDLQIIMKWKATKKSAAAVAAEQVRSMMGGLAGGLGDAEQKALGGDTEPAAVVEGTLGIRGFDQDNVDELDIEWKINPGTERTADAEHLNRRMRTEGQDRLRHHLRDWGKRLSEEFDPHRNEKFAVLKPGQKVSVTRDGGVTKQCVKPGTGDEFPTPGSKVKVHYVGTLEADGKQFDSSRERGEPVEVELGRGKVIKGWDEGIATMRQGEVAKLVIRSDYAYGEKGAGDTIPGKATLVFEVEILSWEKDKKDVSKGQDGGVVKHAIEEGRMSMSMQNAQYEAKCTVDVKCVKGSLKGGLYADPGVENAVIVIGDEQVPPGLEVCLGAMMVGELADVEIAERQLGPFSAGGDVVLRVRMHDFDNPAPPGLLKGDALIAAVTQRKEQGTALYKAKALNRAKGKWNKAVELIEAGEKNAGAHKAKLLELKLPCLTNLAAVQLMHKDFRDCIANCDKALDLDPRNIKAALRRAKAKDGCGETAEARDELNWILAELDPKSADAIAELARLDKREGEAKEKEKKTFGGMFDKMASKKEEAAQRKAAELKEQRAREAAAKFEAHLAELRKEGRLPEGVEVQCPQVEGIAGSYTLDAATPWKGQPIWRSGERVIYCDGPWWMITDDAKKMSQGRGSLQSGSAAGRLPHEAKEWLRSVPGVGWERDSSAKVTAAPRTADAP
eukprot:Hpha_TRINITY_DN16746_c3_g9::TRINITY_DN16746_c3_g9_i1::g.76765::m.76765/K09571/FKBP4_5; FK506-binding protein 4/5